MYIHMYLYIHIVHTCHLHYCSICVALSYSQVGITCGQNIVPCMTVPGRSSMHVPVGADNIRMCKAVLHTGCIMYCHS